MYFNKISILFKNIGKNIDKFSIGEFSEFTYPYPLILDHFKRGLNNLPKLDQFCCQVNEMLGDLHPHS